MSLAGEILQSVKFVREHHGWKAVTTFLILPFIEDISGFILVGSLKDAIPPVPPTLPLEIREATPEDAPRFRNIIPPFRIRRFVRKMKAGERCAIGLLDDEVIYYVWASFAGQPTAAESPFKLGPKDAYFWGAYCKPEYRRYGVSTSVSSYHEDLICQQGYETSYRRVKFKNRPSQKLCEKLKLNIVGRAYGVRFLNWRFSRNILGESR